MLILGIFMIVINSRGTLSDTIDSQYYCPDYHPQKTIELNQIWGLWEIIEIIHHQRIEGQGLHNFVYLKQCPTIHIGHESQSDVRIVWNESQFSVYYKARINDPTSPGFWTASGPHNDTFLDRHYYIAFNGVIQIMKAVHDHIVLTFCTRQHPETQLFSVVLARESRTPSPASVVSVHRMLERRGLDPVFIKRTCSGAAKITSVFIFQIFIFTMWRFFA